MPPTDRDRDNPTRKPRARKPRARKPGKPPVDSDTRPGTNGHVDWPDYRAQTTTWDPWDEGAGAAGAGAAGAGGEGLNRTLGEWLEAVVPPEAQLHFFNAGREFAAGLQTTFDYHLRRGDEDDEGAQALRIEIE